MSDDAVVRPLHLVIPSMPGYGFSGPTTEKGWTVRRIARAWAVLMDRLGYDRYGAQGGDWGSMVSREIAPPVRRLAERSENIVHWTEFDRGGHFAAMEQPELLVGDVREFFRRFR
jgi:pimeloyl-ACP methyl ester carboxylesterase